MMNSSLPLSRKESFNSLFNSLASASRIEILFFKSLYLLTFSNNCFSSII
nr:MAG TPA: hypothetical protein [Bacteriophage sp.]